ncbi:MAG: tetratricopeptide repeat protein, partial [Magnetococcales bacterium]|nr:tetratricopeptide repeat protein [Magnetococcales bacterium]
MNPASTPAGEPDLDEMRSLITLFSSGNHPECERLARGMTERFPMHGFGWKALGLAVMSRKQFAGSLEYLKKAVELLPNDAETHSNLGIALHELGQLAEAATSLNRALALAPDFVVPCKHLGVIMQKLGRLDDAESFYRRVLALKPDAAEVYHSLGTVLKDRNALDEAVTCYQRALSIRPDFVDACNNLGNALRDQGKSVEAETCYRRALAIQADLAPVHHNLGVVLADQWKLEEAAASYRRALELAPEHVESLINLGNTLYEQFRMPEAEDCYRRALALKPDDAAVHNNLGNALSEQWRLEEATDSFRRASTLDPNLGNALASLYHCLQSQCQWQTLSRDAERVRAALANGVSVPVFALLSFPYDDGQLLRSACALHVQELLGPLAHLPPLVDPWHHPRRERLRIGYVSADFRNHPVTQLLAAVIEMHDRAGFEVYGYAYGPDTRDEGRQRIMGACDVFRDVGKLPDDDSAAWIAQDGIDILLDLSGNTQHHRIRMLSHRPAPILVNFSFPGTMGHARVADYKISDAIASPPGMANDFSETLALLPHSQQPNDCNRPLGPRPSRREAGLPEAG